MNLTLLKKLVRILEKSGVDEIEVEEEGLRVRIGKNSHRHSGGNSEVPISQQLNAPVASTAAHTTAAAPPAQATPPAQQFHEIRSPIVGTFYRAPAPEADSYVEVGQIVQPKTVLCIIEAMKLMNEIESDVAGRIVKILVENGQPVEYNQVLFMIEPE